MKIDLGPGDARNFVFGAPVRLLNAPGRPFRLRLATRRDLVTMWLRNRWLSATRWFRPRTVTSAVDVEAGSITLVTERWSWRRWRWERA